MPEEQQPATQEAANESAPVPEKEAAAREVHVKATENVPPSVSNDNPAHKLIVVTTPAPNTEAGPSEQKSLSAHHTGSVVYGDEFLSVEEELQYLNPREQLPIFLDGAGAKGPLFNQNAYLEGFAFFQMSPYNGP